MKPETKFRSSKVIPFLKTLKYCTFFSIQQASISGTPDLLCCIRGIFVALELKKSNKDKPTRLQSHMLKEVERACGMSFVVNPENWDDIKLILQNINDV